MKEVIGIFDSGVGGLTVLKEIRRRLPHSDIVYLGDTARVPYGEKSRDTVEKYAIDNSKFLCQQGIDILVIACNTATAFALETVASLLPIPVVGVVEPGAESAARVTKNGAIAVIGTKGTILSKVYEEELKKIAPSVKVYAKACPLFVPLVEEGMVDHPATELIAKEYLDPLLDAGVDTILLGCTHYPLLARAIASYCKGAVTLVDSAKACAEKVAAIVGDSGNKRAGKRHPAAERYFVTDDPEKFRRLGKQLLDITIEELTLA